MYILMSSWLGERGDNGLCPWDDGNRSKCLKHGVSTEEVESLFLRPIIILSDEAHSVAEARFKAVGKTAAGRHIFQVFTIREKTGQRYVQPSAPLICTGKKLSIMKKKIPTFKSDKEAEAFVDTADLTKYDLSGAKPVRFEFEKKQARVNMRMPESLLKAVKNRAKTRGIPYQRFIRETLEDAVTRK
jgi:predicted DNA binding CopG/RHH family protein/uncharacterized DUF497 family protein